MAGQPPPVAQLPPTLSDSNTLATLYQEVGTNYRAIDDYRTKLLGFLPLASGAGIFFLLNNSVTGIGGQTAHTTSFAQFLLPIGLVGAIVTLGIFFYDLRAIQIRTRLVKAGRDIEGSLGIAGQFIRRPHARFGVVNDLGGSTLVYTALVAGWLFLALVLISLQAAWIVASIVFCAGAAVVVFSGKVLQLLNIDHQEVQHGNGTIPAGQSDISVPTSALRDNSIITVMPFTTNKIFVPAHAQKPDSFTVKLGQASDHSVEFEWWNTD